METRSLHKREKQTVEMIPPKSRRIPGRSVSFSATKEREENKLRPYQKELAQPALEGKNVIVCAPTGSGKTHVAVEIAREHLRKLKGSASTMKPKVAFLVHRVLLVNQQSNLFKRLLKPEFTVDSMSGDEVAGTPLKYKLKDCDVMIMTVDILLNALTFDGPLARLKSITKFSLLIFDECHNCDKDHPYNRIMQHYFDAKKTQGPTAVPQIVGLTASPGTDKANKSIEAQLHLIKLMANLDCFEFKLVKDDVVAKMQDEKREDELYSENPRKPDPLDSVIQSLMESCEKHLENCYERGYFTRVIRIPSSNRRCQQYTNFVGELQDLSNKTKHVGKYRNSINAIYQFLDIYNKALEINGLFRAEDARQFMQKKFEDAEEPTCKIRTTLLAEMRDEEELQDYVEIPNPALERLKRVVIEQLNEEPDSRIIIFVKQRSYTKILVQYFKDNPEFTRVKADFIVGSNAGAESGGISQVWQNEVLYRFREGKKNVVISTTVAEEGLDVVKCNLVVRYGHVTNETAMIQSKGRARAPNSKYIVIIPYTEGWQKQKEQTNKYREHLMFEAIDWLCKLDTNHREKLIREAQTHASEERKLEELTKKTTARGNDDRVFEFHCLKCDLLVCDSKDFRLSEGKHHYMVNEEHLDKLEVIPGEVRTYGTPGDYQVAGKVVCKECKKKWGGLTLFKKVAYPNLAISNFRITEMNVDTVRPMIKKQWKNAPFNVETLEYRDIIDRYERIGNIWAGL